MCIMMDELREHAEACKSLGQFTTANILEHAADWIDGLNDTHFQERKRIRELEALAGVQIGGCIGKPEHLSPKAGEAFTRREVTENAPARLVKHLKERRRAMNLSQAALARVIGCCAEHIGDIEAGKATPSLPVMVAWGNAVGLVLKWEDQND